MKKWLLRLLVVIAAVMTIGIISLNIISGTGETQRRGLEQSFSQILGGTANFGKLVTFNIFPDLTIAIDNLAVTNIRNTGSLYADKAEVSFSALGLMIRDRRIKKFNVENMRADEGVFTSLSLHLDKAGLFAGTEKGKGVFAFEGKYGDLPLKGEITLDAKSGIDPSYRLSDENAFTINIGASQISGIFVPSKEPEGGGIVRDLALFVMQKSGKNECSINKSDSWSGQAFLKEALGGMATLKKPEDFNVLCNSILKHISSVPTP